MEELRVLKDTAPTSGLFRLPYELRLQIYHDLIPRKRVVEAGRPRFNAEWLQVTHYANNDVIITVQDEGDAEETTLDTDVDLENSEPVLGDFKMMSGNLGPDSINKNILHVSSHITREALDVLYGDNIFKLKLSMNGEDTLKRNFTAPNTRRIQHLLVVVDAFGSSFPLTRPDVELWSIVVPKLKCLRIVAKQPEARNIQEDFFDPHTLEERMGWWTEYLTPYLQCFGKYLAERTTLEVDFGGQKETREIVEQYLSGSYREVRCPLVGDLLFHRGKFSIASGFWDWDNQPNPLPNHL